MYIWEIIYLSSNSSSDQDTLDLISKELSGEVSPEKFLEVYNFIMADEEDKHMMMFVDLFRKPEHPSIFRRNYTPR